MGAVYQAWDQELGVIVALKVIRPEAMADPSLAGDLERRFKRELLLARNVTHKNVVRIHDLGEIDGIKYITMPYIHGMDLAALLKREGKLSVPRALAIAKQVASGLVSAHEAGVVHRDLKPANIMLDEEDRALITDFGIARSTSGTVEGTVAGAVVGTVEYMAPEQARAESVDHRADIYAFGLIVYDMLLGKRHIGAGAESAVAALMTRMTTQLLPLRSIDPQIPQTISDIVARCTALDPANRYQTTQELARHLDSLDPNGHPIGTAWTTITAPAPPKPAPQFRLPAVPVIWVAAAIAALAVVSGLYLFRDALFTSGPAQTAAAAGDPVSLAILPFRNASGDSSLDWLGTSIPGTVRTEIGQSSSLRTVAPDRLHQILRDLRVSPNSTLDPSTLASLAEWSNADVVLWGQYLKFGTEIRIEATLQHVKGQTQIPLKAQASSEAALLAALTDLARGVRENLSLSRDEVEELTSKAFRPSTGSIAALKHYNEGLEAMRQGRTTEARTQFEASTREDGSFALAYSNLAETYARTSQTAEAERFSRQAVNLAAGLPEHERLLIQARHAQIVMDYPRAVESYESLAKIWPDSDDALVHLGTLYALTGAYERARDAYATLLKRDPKYVAALVGAGEAETQLGNAQQALTHLNTALPLAIQFDNQEQQATIHRAIGTAYGVAGRPDEALRHLDQSLTLEQQLKRRAGIGDTLFSMGNVYLNTGKLDEAQKAYEGSLALSREIQNRRGIADALINLGVLHGDGRGDHEAALNRYREALQTVRDLGDKNSEALVLNNIGNIYLNRAQFEEARTYFERALTLHEQIQVPGPLADTLHNLGVTAANAGDFGGAVRYYLRALENRRKAGRGPGEAIELYSIGVQYEYQGQLGKAIESHEAALKKLEEIGESGFWLIAIQAQYASALSQAGRAAEAQPLLHKALSAAQSAGHQHLIAQIPTFQGDAFLFQGDYAQARTHYGRALQAAKPAGNRFLLPARAGLAKIATVAGNPRAAVQELQQLVRDLDSIGLKYLAVECSIYLGEALLKTDSAAPARATLEEALRSSERLGLRVLQARSHALLARALTKAGDTAGAQLHSEQARQLLQQIRQEVGTDAFFKRSDLASVLPPS
jgi:serine/threonine protein kinase/Tfp pilus assembly protein PilF